MVVAYRTNPISGALARRLIRVPHVALPNLILGRTVVPELLQEACTPEALAGAARALLVPESAAASRQARELAELRAGLRVGGVAPSECAARQVLEAIAA